jgi:hypothetical protein
MTKNGWEMDYQYDWVIKKRQRDESLANAALKNNSLNKGIAGGGHEEGKNRRGDRGNNNAKQL